MTIKFTSDELKEFADKLPELGVTNEATARNLRNSTLLLLSSVADGEYEDISDINVDKLLEKYAENADSEPSEASIQTYKSRFNSTIAKFLEYKQNDDLIGTGDESVNLKPPSGIYTPRKRRIPKQEYAKSISENSEQSAEHSSHAGVAGKISTNHSFDAQFLLRPESGLSIELKGLPLDITNEEAERIASFLKIYARPQ